MQLVAAVLAAMFGSTALTAWIVGHYGRSTVKADAAEKIGNAALAMVKSIQAQLDDARVEIDEQRVRIKYQDLRIIDLETAHRDLLTAKREIEELKKLVIQQGQRITELEAEIRRINPQNPILEQQ